MWWVSRPTELTAAVEIGTLEGSEIRRADIAVAAAPQRAPAPVAARVDVVNFAAHRSCGILGGGVVGD